MVVGARERRDARCSISSSELSLSSLRRQSRAALLAPSACSATHRLRAAGRQHVHAGCARAGTITFDELVGAGCAAALGAGLRGARGGGHDELMVSFRGPSMDTAWARRRLPLKPESAGIQIPSICAIVN